MGSKVKVPCPSCGEVWIPAEHVVLTVSDGGASYLFRCKCGGRFYRACSRKIAVLLESVAVVDRIEPEAHHGLPLTADEMLDFAIALNDADFISELEEA